MMFFFIRFLLPLFLFSFTSLTMAASTCQKAKVAVQVLGSGGPELDDQRASSSYIVWRGGQAKVLVDIGGGASLRFEESGAKIEDLAAIAFTHLHVDHSADFPALVKAAFFSRRQQDLPLYGPEGNELLPSMTQFVQTLFGRKGAWPYLSDFLPKVSGGSFKLKPTTVAKDKKNIQVVYDKDGITLSAISTHHGPLPALAWRVDVGDKSISFSGDMNNDYHTLTHLAQNSDVLIAHNAVPESATGVARRLHMPPSVIGQISKDANIKQLVLSHRMKRTLGAKNATATMQEIRKNYQGKASFANDLNCFVVAP